MTIDTTTIPGIVGPTPLTIRSFVWRAARAPSKDSRSRSVVIVHGWGIAASYAVPLAERLARECDVYVPELPGHGKSDHDVRPLTISQLAAGLQHWLSAHQLIRPVLVAHSLGCQVAVEVAIASPHRCGALVLIGPTLDPRARPLLRLAGRTAYSLVFERPSLALSALADYSRAGLRVLLREWQEMRSHDIASLLPKVAAPALVIRGGRDWIAPQRWAEQVAQSLRAPAPVVIPGWGHAVHYGHPDAVARHVLRIAEFSLP